MAAPALRIEGLRVEGSGGRPLLTIDRLEIAAGDSVAITGPSGAGKSTLLNVLSGLVRPVAGRVLWDDLDLASLSDAQRASFRRERVGLIFQDFNLFEELSAQGNAALAAAFAPADRRGAIRQGAQGWLAQMGLGAAGRRTVSSFSGGERQRIAVARALATDPAILLADEPTASLDRASADALGADLVRLSHDGHRTLIAVTHDSSLAARMARQILVRDGQIVQGVAHG